MIDSRSQFQEETRFNVLRTLEQNPEISRCDLDAALEINEGSTHYVLKALAGKGLVKLGSLTASEDKHRYAYVLTPKGIARRAAMTRNFLVRKTREYEGLRAEIQALTDELEKDNPETFDLSEKRQAS